jgi:hypothetical protein
MRRAPHVITFRLDPTHFALLLERAGRGVSAGTYARELVLRALHSEVLTASLEARLEAISRQQDATHESLERVLKTAIISGSKLSEAEAREAARRILRTSS